MQHIRTNSADRVWHALPGEIKGVSLGFSFSPFSIYCKVLLRNGASMNNALTSFGFLYLVQLLGFLLLCMVLVASWLIASWVYKRSLP
jgi:hypothetical protein